MQYVITHMKQEQAIIIEFSEDGGNSWHISRSGIFWNPMQAAVRARFLYHPWRLRRMSLKDDGLVSEHDIDLASRLADVVDRLI